VRGHGALTAGLLVAPLGAVAALSAGRIGDRARSPESRPGRGARGGPERIRLHRIGARTGEAWVVLAVLAIGAGLGFVGPPAMGSLYRTLSGPLLPQGSSLLYMLNQLGGSAGVAIVALILGTAGDSPAGFRGVYEFVTVAILVLLAASALLPGRPAIPSALMDSAEIPPVPRREISGEKLRDLRRNRRDEQSPRPDLPQPRRLPAGRGGSVSAFSAGQVEHMGIVPSLADPTHRGLAPGAFQLVFLTGGSLGAAIIGGLSGVLSLRVAVALLAAVPLAGILCATGIVSGKNVGNNTDNAIT
jgi:hypothetical protein